MLRFNTSSNSSSSKSSKSSHSTSSFKFPNLYRLFSSQLSGSQLSSSSNEETKEDKDYNLQIRNASSFIEQFKKANPNDIASLFEKCPLEEKQSLLLYLRILRINGIQEKLLEKHVCKNFHLFKDLPFEVKHTFVSSLEPGDASLAFSKLECEDQKKFIAILEVEEIEYSLGQLPPNEQQDIMKLIEKEASECRDER